MMLTDGNRQARANAAIGLARNGSVDGVPTLIQLLTTSLTPFEHKPDPNAKNETTPEEIQQADVRHQIEESQIARNCLKAVADLWPQIDAENRVTLVAVIGQVKQNFFASDVCQQAGELLQATAQP